MWFFRRKKRVLRELKKEAEIQAVRKETFKEIDKQVKRIDDTIKKMENLTDSLDDKQLGVAGRIFYATGGQKRIKR